MGATLAVLKAWMSQFCVPSSLAFSKSKPPGLPNVHSAISYISVAGTQRPTAQTYTFTFFPNKGVKAFYAAGPSRP